MAVFTSNNSSVAGPWQPKGLVPFRSVTTVPTTALDSGDEQVLLHQFPSNIYGNESWLVHCVVNFDDLDTNATETLVIDIGIGDVDGVIDTALLVGSVAAQDALVDVVLDPSADMPVDVAGRYLIMDVTTTAATPAAGDVTVFGLVAHGVNSTSDEAA